jgi:hypothetical protein
MGMKHACILGVALVACCSLVRTQTVPLNGKQSGPSKPCETADSKVLPFCDTRLGLDDRIEDLISRLTIDEKVR